MRILLSNDDGILAPGLAAMWEALTELGEVHVAAPEDPQSAAAHGITVTGPLSVRRVHVADKFYGHSVDGRPADCVKLAISQLMDEPPDLVVSGINDGANISLNIIYSGTVAAAAEGAVLGHPAIAVSLERGLEPDFAQAARIALPVIRQLLDHGLKEGQLINVNIPDLTPGPPAGVRVVPMATRVWIEDFVHHRAPDGRDYFWLTGEHEWQDSNGLGHGHEHAETDLDAVQNRYVTITPLQFDLTQYALLEKLKEKDWELRGER